MTSSWLDIVAVKKAADSGDDARGMVWAGECASWDAGGVGKASPGDGSGWFEYPPLGEAAAYRPGESPVVYDNPGEFAVKPIPGEGTGDPPWQAPKSARDSGSGEFKTAASCRLDGKLTGDLSPIEAATVA